MNLGHTIGTVVRDQVREATSARSKSLGVWHQVGQITIERVRTVVEELDPVRFEAWQTQTDERTCPICGQLHGVVWQEDEGFTPPVHDHCRCERVYHHLEFNRRTVEEWQQQLRWKTRTEWEWKKTA